MDKINIKSKDIYSLKIPTGYKVAYVSGKTPSHTFGNTSLDKETFEDIASMKPNALVTITLENIQEAEKKEKEFQEEMAREKREQEEMARVFKATKKKVEVTENTFSKNVYTTYVDEINKITRTDWNGQTGKYYRIGGEITK